MKQNLTKTNGFLPPTVWRFTSKIWKNRNWDVSLGWLDLFGLFGFHPRKTFSMMKNWRRCLSHFLSVCLVFYHFSPVIVALLLFLFLFFFVFTWVKFMAEWVETDKYKKVLLRLECLIQNQKHRSKKKLNFNN